VLVRAIDMGLIDLGFTTISDVQAVAVWSSLLAIGSTSLAKALRG
jgi:hypothetical protein